VVGGVVRDVVLGGGEADAALDLAVVGEDGGAETPEAAPLLLVVEREAVGPYLRQFLVECLAVGDSVRRGRREAVGVDDVVDAVLGEVGEDGFPEGGVVEGDLAADVGVDLDGLLAFRAVEDDRPTAFVGGERDERAGVCSERLHRLLPLRVEFDVVPEDAPDVQELEAEPVLVTVLHDELVLAERAEVVVDGALVQLEGRCEFVELRGAASGELVDDANRLLQGLDGVVRCIGHTQ